MTKEAAIKRVLGRMTESDRIRYNVRILEAIDTLKGHSALEITLCEPGYAITVVAVDTLIEKLNGLLIQKF